ncbi:hypothetical protein J7I98_19045 [Streptomyces sp. ISL-98]|uniref:DUF6114 domain-containing protein n=1 Tax=Streptomyces sp. ISL-98 TaxID=2819192 RepID=UPI001BEB978A|nr:DUF6114 domain-containing protein [Streptomyces sp. ISL-98]MBT2507942.1 hypothetical protein [Streptomyces sp. ISL-98]
MITLILGFGAELAKETGTWLDQLLPAPRLRARARSWRRRRPFWAGLWTLLAGLEMIFLPLAPLPLMLKVGVGAMSALGVGLVLIAGGLFFVFAPAQRIFVSVMTAIASLVSLATTNLGGFGIGVGLGLLGSSMAFGWLPGAPEAPGSGRGWVRSDAAADTGRRSPATADGDGEVPGGGLVRAPGGPGAGDGADADADADDGAHRHAGTHGHRHAPAPDGCALGDDRPAWPAPVAAPKPGEGSVRGPGKGPDRGLVGSPNAPAAGDSVGQADGIRRPVPAPGGCARGDTDCPAEPLEGGDGAFAAGVRSRQPSGRGSESGHDSAPEHDEPPAGGGGRGRTGSQPFVPAAWGVECRDPKGCESRAVRRSSAVPGVPGGDCAALVRRLLAVPLALTLVVGVLGVSPGRSGAAERCGEPEREVPARARAECPDPLQAAGSAEEEPQASGDGGNVTLPCLTGLDTGGRDNPPAEGDPPSRQTAEPGKVGRPGDLTALKPPLVVGKQPGPGRAAYPVSPYHPEVGATRLDAYDAVIHGATYLPTLGGGRVKVLWVHAERLVAKDYHLEVAGPDGTPQTIDVQLDIRNVDVYATELTASIEIPFLKVNTPRICIGADVVPANLPVAVQLPRLTVESVEAGQVLVDAADVRFSGLTTRTSN